MWLTIFIAISLSNLKSKFFKWFYDFEVCETCLSFWIAIVVGIVHSGSVYQALGYAGVTWVAHRVLNQYIMEL